VNFNGQYEAVL